MAVLSTNSVAAGRAQLTTGKVALWLACTALLLTALQYTGLLPAWLHRIPESWIPPFAVWLDAAFNFIRTDLGLEKLTRWFAEGPLQFMLDTTANLLYGKRRWPRFEQIPWSAIAATAAVLLALPGIEADAHPRGAAFEHGPGMGVPDPAMMIEHLADHLDLDDAQRASVESIVAAVRPEAEALRTQFKANREALDALYRLLHAFD